MSPLRRVPPAHSPVPPRALAAGLRALLAPDGRLRDRMTERVARRFGARRVVFTDSGTSALALALAGAAAAGERGGRVALPAYGCYDLVTAVRGAGVEAVLYDLEPATLSPVPDSLDRALDAGAGTVVAAHLYGVPVRLDEVAGRADDAGALLVEDAAQGVGAEHGGRPLGSHGSVSILSFGRGKGLSGGGGGALLAHDDRGEAVVEAKGEPGRPGGRGLRELAAAAAQWALGRPALYGLPAALPFLELGETVYRSPRPPAEIPTACLAVLERSWGPSLREAEGRRRRARRLLDAVRAAGDLEPVRAPPEGRPGWLRLPVLARSAAARERLAGPAARRLGVMTGYPRPLHRLEACREALAGGRVPPEEELAGAATLARSLYTLPVHGRTGRTDLGRLEELVSASLA